MFSKKNIRYKKEDSAHWKAFGIWFNIGDTYESLTCFIITIKTFKWYRTFSFVKHPFKIFMYDRGNYKEIIERKYGFIYMDQSLRIYHGLQSNNNLWHTKDAHLFNKWKHFDNPFINFRFIYHHLLNLDKSLFMDATDLNSWELNDIHESVKYKFEDYDKEIVIATCRVDKRMWRRGTGWFKFIGYITKKKISVNLDLLFSAEIGARKGSWKGGTIGHSIDFISNEETPEEAFKRYCENNNLNFIGEVKDVPESIEN